MVQSWTGRCTIVALTFALLGARSASADTLLFVWDLSTEPEVAGYVVHIGTRPGVYSQSIDVGNTDRFVFSNPVAGQRYCFVVTSYAGYIVSPPSGEVCGSIGTPPYLDQPSNQTTAAGQSVTLQLVGGHPEGAPVTYSTLGLPPGLLVSQSLGLISGVPTTAGTYNVTAIATSSGLSASRSFTWSVQSTNRAPSLVNPGPQTSDVGQPVSLRLRGSDPDGQTLTYGATGLPPGVTVTSAGQISGTPTAVGTFNVTATVSDGELSATQLFAWTVRAANVAPVLTNPGNQATDVGTPVSLQLQATDANGDSLTYAANGLPAGLQIAQATGAITGTPTAAATHTVNVTVSDGVLSDSRTFTWNVRTVNAAPTLQNPGSLSADEGMFTVVNLQGADPNGDPLTYSATGLPPGLQLTAGTGRIAGAPTAPGSFTVSAAVSDGTLTATQSFTWVVRAKNVAPELTTPADQTGRVNSATTLQLQATDANGDTLAYVASGLPAGLALNPATGLISGTPTLAGTYAVEVIVSDGAAFVSAVFAWTVEESSDGGNLSLSNPGTQRHNVGQAVSLQLRSNGTGTLTFSVNNLPPGLSLDAATGLITGSPTTAGTYTVTVSVTNGTSSATRGFTWIIRSVNAPPVLTNPGPQSHEAGDAVTLQLQASDENGDTLSYAAAGLPAGLQIDPAVGRISGFPTAAGTYSVTATVSDGTLSASQTFTWTIAAANAAPTLAAPGGQTSTVGRPASLQLQGADADGDTLTYSASGLPAGVQIDMATGLIAGTPTAAGSYAVTASVSDGRASASRSFTWTVLRTNAAPTLAPIADQSSTAGQSVALQLQGADPDNDVLVYSATGLPPGLHLHPNTGTISGSPSSAGTYTVTATVSDGELDVRRSLTWTVVLPNVAPTLEPLTNQSSAVGQSVLVQLLGEDANGDVLTYSATGLPFGVRVDAATGRITGVATSGGTYTVTATVSDGLLSATRVFTWTVTSVNVAPLLRPVTDQATSEGDVVSLQIQATDDNGDQLTYAASGLPPGLQIAPGTGRIAGRATVPGTYTVTIAVSDGQLTTQRSFNWRIVERPIAAPTPERPSTRSTASAGYTGSAASSRPAPAPDPGRGRQYSGAASGRAPADPITAPITAPREYTGTAALTRSASDPAGAPVAAVAYTGSSAAVREAASPAPAAPGAPQTSGAVTRSVVTSQVGTGLPSGGDTAIDTSMSTSTPDVTVVSAPRSAPVVSIDTPVDSVRFDEGTTVIFTGRAFDPEDGALSHAIYWSSSLDGPLGSGAMVTRVLSKGTHTITARVIDSSGNAKSAQVTVKVE